MLYMKCPTCKELLGNKQIPYEVGIRKICDDPNLSDEEKLKQENDLVVKLHLNYCCNTRLITYKKLIDIIKP